MEEKLVNKNVGLAKRVFTTEKKESFAVDKISRAEQKLFVDDLYLAEKIQKKKDIDSEIIEYIDEKLKEHRRNNKIPSEDLDRIIEIKCDLEELAIETSTLKDDYDFIKEVDEVLNKILNMLMKELMMRSKLIIFFFGGIKMRKLKQNKLLLELALENEEEKKKFEFIEILNDNGLYCGANGVKERIRILDVKNQNNFIRHLLGDINSLLP